ncbi:hypothetical protein E3O42_04490 [Cryobacterium adonitolivorans]|uniref:Uncharacterized protein n=1 Tax=Cryobacterium adonitolivorans TaxID=1259189 RepID=A0A4R8W943_9MICO|nr:hypothetical protein [Cryobacterium adonitolivorans]TFC04763.1 hypothetical protein E3O42_04490 [Cryobacterium adonitolivorans]
MSKNKSDEPRDEFDRIQIPEFLTRPFERLAGGPAVRTPTRHTPSDQPAAGTTADDDTAADAPENPDDSQPAPRQWWAGYKGKLLLYGAGTLVMVFLQSRG